MEAKSNIAVLIDFENVGIDTLGSVIDEISKLGRITVKRAYADWSSQRPKREALGDLGIEPVHHFRQTRASKNASDISLTVDAMELLHSSPIDTFVIASSDSDFVPLVNILRTYGKIVIGVGRHATVSESLIAVCDKYMFLDEVKKSKPVAQGVKPVAENGTTPKGWDKRVHELWSKRGQGSIPGPQAASAAASVLGVRKLKDSTLSSLQRLLEASQLLFDNWRRDGNVIIKKKP